MQHSKIITTVVIAGLSAPALAGTCATDLDGDGSTGFSDLTAMLNAWGPCAACPEDVNGDDNVGFADLTELLNAWGPCPADTFDYPAYENMFAVVVGQQFLNAPGSVELPQATYDRMDTDMQSIMALRPEVTDSQSTHVWRWVPFRVLVGIDTSLPSDEFDATLAFYQGEIIDSYFGGSTLVLDFPLGGNPNELISIFETLDNVEFGERDNYFQTGPLTPRWAPADVGGGALLWTVVVGWDNGAPCNIDFSPCECITTYEFLTQADGTAALLGVSSVPSPWNPNATCVGYPPTP